MDYGTYFSPENGSPSSRRAWVEIVCRSMRGRSRPVALLAEGVGRNSEETRPVCAALSRPPRGGRG